MQEAIIIKAHAKLNLTLTILEKRADGYHDLDSLMLPIDLHDSLSITPSNSCFVSYGDTPASDDDLVYKAITAYAAQTNKMARVSITKRIPSEAGLGGGSADAAAVLNALQSFYHSYTDEGLAELGLSLGCDIPFCLQKKPCRVTGKGEILESFESGAELWFVLAKPQEGISTGELFSSLRLPLKIRPDTKAAVKALKEGDIVKLGSLMGNSLEANAIAMSPQISHIKDTLKASGALGVSMSGSGSCVAALYMNREQALCAARDVSSLAFYTVARNIPI